MHGYDLARAIAIIGMVLINFPIFLAATEDSAGTIGAWLANVHAGRAAGLFVTLAGAGVALMTRGGSLAAVRRVLLLRAAFLFVAGNLLIMLWPIDILHFYAFYLAIAALALIVMPRWTLLWGAGLIALAAVAVNVAWPELGDDPDLGVFWPRDGFEFGAYWTPLGMLQNVFVSGIHALLPWIALVMIGLWIGGCDLGDGPTRRRLMWGGAALAVAAPLLSTLADFVLLAVGAPAEWFTFTGVAHAPSPLWVMGAAGTSMFAIALCQAIVVRWDGALPVRALVHAGQMAFTIYITHALIGVVFPQAFLGWEQWPLGGVIAYSFAFCAIVVALAHLYRLHFQRGPIELLMRRIAGETPPKIAPTQRAHLRAPPRVLAPIVVTAFALVVAIQVFGSTAPSFGCGAEKAAEDRVTSQLTLACRTREFTLNVRERADVTLETHSGRDLYLELYRGDGEMIAQNDDGGVETNARIEETLEPGAYRVRVRPYHAALGPFVLARSDAPPSVRALLPGETCTNTCATSRDNECDDGGPASLYDVCDYGTDCADCGIRPSAPT